MFRLDRHNIPCESSEKSYKATSLTFKNWETGDFLGGR